jgi:hypothetical protein
MSMTFMEHVAAVTLRLLPGDELPDVATAVLRECKRIVSSPTGTAKGRQWPTTIVSGVAA